MKDILLDQGLDIKDLKAVDEGEFKPEFDPQVELTDVDWKSMEAFIELMDSESSTNGGSLDYAVRAALQVQLLTGKRFNLNLATDLNVLRARLFEEESYSDILVRESGGGLSLRALKAETEDLIADLLLINPSFRGELRLEKYRDNFETYFTDGIAQDESYPIERFNAWVILGDSFRNLRLYGTNGQKKFFDPQDLKENLKTWQSDGFLYTFDPKTLQVGLSYPDTVVHWARALACVKVLAPGSELAYLNPRSWGILLGWHNFYRLTDDLRKQFDLAASLYLLSADSLELTDEGLVIRKSVDSEQITAPLPKVRSYR